MYFVLQFPVVVSDPEVEKPVTFHISSSKYSIIYVEIICGNSEYKCTSMRLAWVYKTGCQKGEEREERGRKEGEREKIWIKEGKERDRGRREGDRLKERERRKGGYREEGESEEGEREDERKIREAEEREG